MKWKISLGQCNNYFGWSIEVLQSDGKYHMTVYGKAKNIVDAYIKAQKTIKEHPHVLNPIPEI